MNVSLVSMPFGPLFTPSIALGLLKAIADKRRCCTRTHYFTLDFAKRIGERFYHDIAGGLFPTHLLIGEWIFAGCLGKDDGSASFVNDLVYPLFAAGYYDVQKHRAPAVSAGACG